MSLFFIWCLVGFLVSSWMVATSPPFNPEDKSSMALLIFLIAPFQFALMCVLYPIYFILMLLVGRENGDG